MNPLARYRTIKTVCPDCGRTVGQTQTTGNEDSKPVKCKECLYEQYSRERSWPWMLPEPTVPLSDQPEDVGVQHG